MMSDTRHPDEAMLTDYLEGLLTGRSHARVAAHLAECPRCAREVAAQARLFAVLAALPELAPPRDLTPAVLAALRPAPALPGHFAFLMSLQAGAALLFLALAWHLLAPPLPDLSLASLSLPLADLLRVGETLGALGRSAQADLAAWVPSLPLLGSAFSLLSMLLVWVLGNSLFLRLAPPFSLFDSEEGTP